MLSGGPEVTAADIIPVTKHVLEDTLKDFAKKELSGYLNKLHAAIKKDIHAEVHAILENETTKFKNIEGALGKVMSKVEDKKAEEEGAVAKKLRRKAEVKKNQNMSHKAEIKSRRTVANLGEAKRQQSVLEAGESDAKMGNDGGGRVLTVVSNENRGEAEQSAAEQLLPGESPKSQNMIQRLVLSSYFEYSMAIIVLSNVILLGFETQLQASAEPRPVTSVLDILFCLGFTVELCLRLYVYGAQIWMDDFLFQSVCFDSLLVVLQIADQVVSALDMNVHVLSVLRIVRIARVIRLFHLFDELSALIAGMFNSVNTLLWTCFMVALIMYMFGIIIMQALMTTGDLNNDELNHWFGSVDRSMSTMFEVILGGTDWGLILETLCYEVSPLMGVIMATYIIITLFFMMNLVCGVFVDRVTKTVREDKDEHFAKRLSEAFTTFAADGSENEVNLTDFTAKLTQNQDVQAYFKSLDVQPDIASARGLFELIDADQSGAITASEIVAGCLRLRGPAKALEMALMTTDISRISMQVAANFAAVEGLGSTIKSNNSLLKQIQKIVEANNAMLDIEAPEGQAAEE